MRTLKLLRPYQNKKAGEEIQVSNNIAHSLIENGGAVLSKGRMYPDSDKQMRPGRKQKIRIK